MTAEVRRIAVRNYVAEQPSLDCPIAESGDRRRAARPFGVVTMRRQGSQCWSTTLV